jgi:6-phosphofructokinase 1
MGTSKARIGILTSGGDCPGLNAVIRGAVKSAARLDADVVGFRRGYEGLVDPVTYVALDTTNTSGIISRGGTILGSTNKGRFAARSGVDERLEIDPQLLGDVQRTMDQLGIMGLICIGGDRGTEDDRQRPVRHGVHVRVRQCCRVRDRCHGPVAHDGREP